MLEREVGGRADGEGGWKERIVGGRRSRRTDVLNFMVGSWLFVEKV